MWLAIEPRAMLKRMWPPPAPRPGGDERKIDRVRHEIGLQQEADLLALALK